MTIRFLKFAALGLVALSVAAALGLYAWFWAMPVTVNAFLNKTMLQLSLASPQRMSELGLIDGTLIDRHSGRLDGYTVEDDNSLLEGYVKARADLQRFRSDRNARQDRLSIDVTDWILEDLIIQSEFPHNPYRVTQWSGVVTDIPLFLTQVHAIRDARSAQRYVERVADFERVLAETHTRILADAERGHIPPDFILLRTIDTMQNFVDGEIAANVLMQHFEVEISDIDVSEQARDALETQLEDIITQSILPAYRDLIALYQSLLDGAAMAPGIWRLENGSAHYAALLRSHTSTDMTADEIHELGLDDIARIQTVMNERFDELGVPAGSLVERLAEFERTQIDGFEMTDEGRARMLDYLNELHDQIAISVQSVFTDLPEAPLRIERMPDQMAANGSAGRYLPAAIGGGRSGVFFVNQQDGPPVDRWKLPTLYSHEAVPGHHMQSAYARAMEGLPLVRQFWFSPAYGEGWALYAEQLVEEHMGLYDGDPAGEIGRLKSELFRAARMVVDTGIHHLRWSREQAVDYLVFEAGLDRAKASTEIDRYSVYPAQAVSYKVGLFAMLDMRETAQICLGSDFDLAAFHTQLLRDGPLPLSMLREQVEIWVREEMRAHDVTPNSACRLA